MNNPGISWSLAQLCYRTITHCEIFKGSKSSPSLFWTSTCAVQQHKEQFVPLILSQTPTDVVITNHKGPLTSSEKSFHLCFPTQDFLSCHLLVISQWINQQTAVGCDKNCVMTQGNCLPGFLRRQFRHIHRASPSISISKRPHRNSRCIEQNW